MTHCSICGNPIKGKVHLVYAFVGPSTADADAMELCEKHTNAFIEFTKGAKE